MTRSAAPATAGLFALVLLAASAPASSAAEVTVKVTLDAMGRGDVYMNIAADLDEMTRLAAERDPQVVSLFLTRALRGSPAQITELFRSSGYSGVAVSQKVEKTRVRTDVTATISDVRPLAALAGGNLDFVERPGNYLELHGTLGGTLAQARADLSGLSGVSVKLWVVFPGAVREADGAGTVSHAADSVTWRWSADRLLSSPATIRARVLPRIEGEPRYWLALIVGVTALVVVGVVIVLRRGREARL